MSNIKNIIAIIVLSVFLAGCTAISLSKLNIKIQPKSTLYTLGKDKTINKIEFDVIKDGKISYLVSSFSLEFSGDALSYIGDLPKSIKIALGIKNMSSSFDAKLSSLELICSSDCAGLEEMYKGLGQSELETLYKLVEKEISKIPNSGGGDSSGGSSGDSSGGSI